MGFWTRREMMASAAVAAASGLATSADPKPKLLGRIKHSICAWCFTSAGEKWSLEQLCRVATELGVGSIELVTPDEFGTLAKHRLTCAIASNTMPGSFKTGFNNPRFHDELIERTRKVIDACADFGCPNVIAFTGYKWTDPMDSRSPEIPPEEGARNCVRGLQALAKYAEQKKVTICLEHLNTRDDSHPMKGHPGYQGDHLDEVARIVRAVGSPRVKLLFDIYHVQVMHGDVIRRLEQCREILGHIHTAGNPGRGELDDTQELQYGPIMRKLVALGYQGFVGHEFIPTRDPRRGLIQAIEVCDV